MPKASKKKPINPVLDIQGAINRKMHRQQTPHMFICKYDLDRVWADHPLRSLFPSFEQKECDSIRDSYICVLSILILINWPDLRNSFRFTFLRVPERDDKHLPFTDLAFLEASGQMFSFFQHAFKPIIIEEHSQKHIQVIHSDHRLPFINEPEDVGLGGYGSVTKQIIAPRCLKNKESNQDNPEPKLVACKIYRNENPIHDFKREVQNLDYIKESLTDAKRVMKHIAAIVHGNDFMILLPHADLFDLEIFLRCGHEPDPSTDNQKKIYDFDTNFPMLKTPENSQRALIEEVHQLASALKWLHEDLKIFGSDNRYLAHMDLKPANVLIVGDSRSNAGKWMLSDFGISSFEKSGNARVPDTPSIRDVGYRLTSLGFQNMVVRGHGPYQPPEVDLENVDGRKCDVWSFSCIMCDVLAFAIGRTEAVYRLRNLRYSGGNDYFYRTTGPLRTEIDYSNTELKPQIVQWWAELTEDCSSPGWAADYVDILRKALKSKPSDRPNVAAIVRGLDKLAPSITPQATPVLDPESESLSDSHQISGTVSYDSLRAQQRRPSITVSDDASPPHHGENHVKDLASTDRSHGHPSKYLSPASALQREHGLSPKHEEHASQSSSSSEGQGHGGMHASDTSEPDGSFGSEETLTKRRTSSVSMLNFQERPRLSVSPPKKDKVKAVAINTSPLQVAILCKNAVHLCVSIDREEKRRHLDLTPKVDWTKIRLASNYFAVYGVGPSNKKIIEIYDSESMSPEATVTDNGELAQDILLSDSNVFAYVYSREVKLYFLRPQRRPTSESIHDDDAFIVQAKFNASGKILCVWTSGTRGDHAYFFDVNEELGSVSLRGKGSFQKQNANARICEIWPLPDSPACVVHEAHAGTFLAEPLNQPQAKLQQRYSIGISNALTGCVVRDDLLVCLTSRILHPGQLCGFALSQEPTGQRRIASQGQNLGATSKGIKSSTAVAMHLVSGKVELVLCTTAGEVLRYIES